ncbi:tripartite ATP-independent transporter DctP family solute receptor [Desulfitispora alkaliphila]|uniref:TRAP transporter substrate-binding protein n=1 Tax=Desulfitispora alkaliphila TaxID=622674 RepID=UPI003D213972
MLNSRFKVKGFLAIGLVLILSIALLGCGGSDNGDASGGEEQEVYRMRIGHPMAPGNNVSVGYVKFKEIVEEMSDGRIEIEIYDSAVLGSDRVTHESVQAGTLEMSSSSTPNMANFNNDWMVWDLPYITLYENQEAIYDAIDNGRIGEHFREISREDGFEIIMFSEYGYRKMTTANAPVRTPNDFRGLTLRTTDSPVEIAVANAIGANPVPVAWGEVYTALQQGTVDGQGNTFDLLYAAQHHEATGYAATTDHNYCMHILVMNVDYYNALPEDLQRIVKEAGQKALDWQREVTYTQEAEAKQNFIDHGIEVFDLTDEEMQMWMDVTKPVWDEFIGSTIDQWLVEELLEVQGRGDEL